MLFSVPTHSDCCRHVFLKVIIFTIHLDCLLIDCNLYNNKHRNLDVVAHRNNSFHRNNFDNNILEDFLSQQVCQVYILNYCYGVNIIFCCSQDNLEHISLVIVLLNLRLWSTSNIENVAFTKLILLWYAYFFPLCQFHYRPFLFPFWPFQNFWKGFLLFHHQLF